MNTGELIKQLAKNLNITQKQARRLLEQELDAIAEQLSLDHSVIIRGFGSFSVKQTRSQNLSTAFKASKKLKDRVKSWSPE